MVLDGDDLVEPYLLYSNSHDDSQAIDIRITTIRVVCRNTLSFALGRDPIGHVFHRAHREDPAALEEHARRFFAAIRARLDGIARSLRELAGAPVDDVAFQHFVQHVLPDPPFLAAAVESPSVAKAYDTRLENLALARAAIERIRTEGIPQLSIPPEPPTWWGAVNAVTAWADHLQPVGGDRYAHALFGGGDRFKSDVFEGAMGFAAGRVVSIENARRSGVDPRRA